MGVGWMTQKIHFCPLLYKWWPWTELTQVAVNFVYSEVDDCKMTEFKNISEFLKPYLLVYISYLTFYY